MTEQRVQLSPTKHDHDRYCWQAGHAVEDWTLSPGVVRRCPHGVLQLSYDVPGSVPCYWRDLHWLWTPLLYRRAVRALA